MTMVLSEDGVGAAGVGAVPLGTGIATCADGRVVEAGRPLRFFFSSSRKARCASRASSMVFPCIFPPGFTQNWARCPMRLHAAQERRGRAGLTGLALVAKAVGS